MRRLFDNIVKWHIMSKLPGEERDEWGWEGFIYLEPPVKVDNSAYPYSARVRAYIFTNDWKLIKIIEDTTTGLSGL